jgi:prepilin-type N-terminal cleavage/methylation domain-containing protein
MRLNLGRMKMKRLSKDQRGFSLIELVIVIALTGIITTVITMTIFQVFNMNTRTSNRMTAVSQVQNAGKLVSEDILEAQAATASDNLAALLTLNWTDQGNNKHGVVYYLEGTGGLGTLLRKYYLNSSLNSTTKVAECIAANQTSFRPLGALPPGGVLTFNVTATVGKETETRVYEVKPRPGS